MDKIINAQIYPKRYYGLHMAEGTAQYKLSETNSFMIFIGEKAIKNMDASFEGKPVFVGHRDEVNPQIEPDGHVVKSFFNKCDGKHWVEFMVTTDRGHDAIRNGWRLSNAYVIKKSAAGGKWHGMEYEQEIIEGEYEHLAIVDDPRYEESIVLTPDQFKDYNEKKEAELKKLHNSKTGVKGMFKFFKKEKVENSADLETMSVVLPKSKKEVDISTLINEADEKEMKNNEPEYAVKHMLVKTNEGDMSVEELVNKYHNMCSKKNEEDEEKKENEEDEEKKENKDDGEGLKTEDKDELDNEEEEKEEKKQNSKENFNKLKNAHETFETSEYLDTSMDQVARGKSKYGSGK